MNIPRSTPPDLRQPALLYGEGLNRPLPPRREYRYEPADPDGTLYRVKVTGSFLSPPHHQPPRQIADYRPLSPTPNIHRLPGNPQSPKNRALGHQLRNAIPQQPMSNKMRKNSENCMGMGWGSGDIGLYAGREHKDRFSGLNVPGTTKWIYERQRKASCQLEPAVFFKSRKQSSNQEALATSQVSQVETTKPKRKGWDETNNFHLSTNHNSEEHNVDLTQSQVDCPRTNPRKHSDTYNLKKVPSFLATPKTYRKSFDNCQGQRQKGLGIEDFMIVKQLGKGAFGRVVLAIQRRSRLVCAIKIMSKRQVMQSGMQEQLVRELKIQMFINHPNVAKVYGFFDDLLHFYTLMECALDGHLSEHLARRTVPIRQEEAAVLLYQTCSAVAALHTHSVIHRDLKPQNLLMHEGIVKLSDFGWSVNRGAELRTTFCGTPIYLCPEILVGQQYDESVDIWTIGVILYEMLYRDNPFRITCQEELANILNSSIAFDDSPVSDSAKEVIRACLNKKAAERPNIRELMLFQFVLKGQAADEYKR